MAAQQQEYDDDLVEKRPSNPVTTTVLFFGVGALIAGIWLTGMELGFYLNKDTAAKLSEYKTPVQTYRDESLRKAFEDAAAGLGAATSAALIAESQRPWEIDGRRPTAEGEVPPEPTPEAPETN
jgi:hypothetical protein